MKTGSVVKGISAGITAGAVVYAISNATAREKSKIRSSAGKALRAMGDVADGISMLLR